MIISPSIKKNAKGNYPGFTPGRPLAIGASQNKKTNTGERGVTLSPLYYLL